MGGRLFSTVFQIGMALVLVAIGRLGARRADRFVSPALDEDERERKTRTIRRGGLACYATAGVFVAMVWPIWA